MPEVLVPNDLDRLTTFHCTLIDLDTTAKAALEQFQYQATRLVPDGTRLAQFLQELRATFYDIEEAAQAALPTLRHRQALAKVLICLECFQWQQRFRHYAIACAGEALQEAGTLSLEFMKRYQRVLNHAENLAVKTASAFTLVYDLLGINKGQINFEQGGLK